MLKIRLLSAGVVLLLVGLGLASRGPADGGKVLSGHTVTVATSTPSPAPEAGLINDAASVSPGDSGQSSGPGAPVADRAYVNPTPLVVQSRIVPDPTVTPLPVATPVPEPVDPPVSTPVAPRPCGGCGSYGPGLRPQMMCPMYMCLER
jgi:hypothetical protein